MVFSSFEFMYLFLPPVLGVYLILRHLRQETAIVWWLVMASIAFYAWWSVEHLALLAGSIGFNYALHRYLLRTRSHRAFWFGVVVNLSVLGWFKYADFFIGNINAAAGFEIRHLDLILPLAISFYTFEQITFLHDTLIGRIERSGFAKYVLFITFFPKLIAGPIIMQRDTVPQFSMEKFGGKLAVNLTLGATLFFIGLFKKIVIADAVAPFATAVFTAADGGASLSASEAWMGALAYSFQIYFDFSGYCDMALGIARMFGITLPFNFNSPYKALSISDFWRRWHMSLSRFLRDYLYIALGGNRYGEFRRHVNLMITMLLGGFWHGASWNFIIWGGLHGSYLVINHFWRASPAGKLVAAVLPGWLHAALSWSLTMLAVVVAWVFFRAQSLDGALAMLAAMAGLNESPALASTVAASLPAALPLLLGLLAAFVVLLPNSIEFTALYRPVLSTGREIGKRAAGMRWRPTAAWGATFSAIGIVAIVQTYRLNGLTEFIYYNF